MWRRFLQWVMDNRPTRVIIDQDFEQTARKTPLFFRAFLFELGDWRLYLHHYKRSDPDRGLHDHPSWNVALVLAGGYWEQRFSGLKQGLIQTKWKRVPPGHLNFVDPFCYHRVVIDKGMKTSWSLFLVNYKKAKGKRWGFLRQQDHGCTETIYVLADPANPGKWWEKAPKGICYNLETGKLL